MAEQIDADLAALRGEIGQMRSDLAKLSETLQALIRHGGAEAFDTLRQSTERMKDEVKKTGQSLSREIEERPLAAALIAFLGGVVLGALFGRRS